MCGFVAVISPGLPVEDSLLSVMRDRLIHRGPNNASNWFRSGKRVAFAHRRLSIIDPSHSADQPMVSKDGLHTIVFNGEIYNYIELRADLQALGHTFHTQSDTEVLLTALREWGDSALAKLNGMFAFALWDEPTQRMLVVRDRFGEKPLFIGRGRLNTTIFASEMKAIFAHPLVPCAYNKKSVDRFGTGAWYEDDEQTFFEGVERFPPAHAAWYRDDGTEERRWRYWTPDYTKIDYSLKPRDAVAKFAELMQNSVRLRLRADVPVGSSLSGGLDSSVIVGYLSRERDKSSFTQNTFSAVFPNDLTMSEQGEIDSVVSYTGVNSFKVTPDPIRLMEESPIVHWHQEEPFLSASIYLQWCVARLAQESDTTVLLDGQGADELLAGYQFYYKQHQLDLIDEGCTNLALRVSDKFNRRLRIASGQFKESQRRFNAAVAYTSDELKIIGKPSSAVFQYPYTTGVAPAAPGYRLRRTLSEALLYNSLPMLLRYADRNSMAFSREARLPYLDYDLVDFCISLPDEYYIRNGWQKWILRMAGGNSIPESIRWRADKVGYAAPLDIWLRCEMREWAEERIFDSQLIGVAGYNLQAVQALWEAHQLSRANNSWLLWRWISLAEWFQLLDSGCWKAGK